ncbi:MAG TPA: guanylate kinase [Pyrinomonadaceae bacterium]|nr:guanylate kinase [Pyrinomonadaceae bacterium]
MKGEHDFKLTFIYRSPFPLMKGNLIIISSPSGGGKGTLILELLSSESITNIGYCISYTTREKREGEMHGRDYFFVSRKEFISSIEKDEFLEYAEVHGNFYGTPIRFVQDAINRGKDVILEIDVQGAESVRRLMPEAVGIFILPPSFEILRNRLKARATEKLKDLDLRLRNSFAEIQRVSEFKYVIVNDDVSEATADLQTIILAERLKRIRQTEAIRGILDSFDTSKISSLGD